MTHLSNTPRLPEEGAGFYTDLPDRSRNGNSASRDTPSSRPGSRASMVFPTLHDAPVPDDRLSLALTWSDRLALYGQAALLVLLFGTLGAHFFDVWGAATTHPDPVTQHD